MDIALIKIEGSGYPFLSLGNSDSLEVGQSVIAIGNALGEFRNTVSVGVVSGLARSITAGDNSGKSEVLDHVIQTDAAINPGNSGGPLLNLRGEVVGVDVAIVQGSQNIGFAGALTVFGPLAGHIWRVGLMGSGSTSSNVLLFLAALDEACASTGRDPATLGRSAGVMVALSEEPFRVGTSDWTRGALRGTPAELAEQLRAFARAGIDHLQLGISPPTAGAVEEVGRVLELLDGGS